MATLFALLPLEAALKVSGYPLARNRNLQDRLVWSHSSDGLFTSKTAYVALLNGDSEVNPCCID